MENKNVRNILLVVFGLILFSMIKCGTKGTVEEHVESPLTNVIRKLSNEKTYTVLLWDMDVEGSGSSKRFKHKYKIIREKDSIPYDSLTPWNRVGSQDFWAQEANMGMEILSKDSTGKLNRVASPPGYSNYVGNSHYGQWRERDGNRFWEFYGQYMFMRTMFNMAVYPIYYHNYYSYRGSYYGHSPYYGNYRTGGGKTYGTYSQHNKTKNADFFERKKKSTSWSRSTKNYGRGGGGYGK